MPEIFSNAKRTALKWTVIGIALITTFLSAEEVQFTFKHVPFPDGRVGTILVTSKSTEGHRLTTCVYYSDPYDEYLGQYQNNHFTSSKADTLKQFCLVHYQERQKNKL